MLYQSEDGLRLDTKTLYDHDGEPFPDHYKTLESGDAVVCRTVEVPGWPYNPDFFIDKFVNKREEKVYRLTGETFPEVPPDLHPNGYYG